MSWGLKVWRSDGFEVVNLTSKAFAVISAGSYSFTVNDLVLFIPINNTAQYGSRLHIVTTTNPAQGLWFASMDPSVSVESNGVRLTAPLLLQEVYPMVVTFQVILR